MDVTAGELLSHIDAGEDDPEVLKRLTSCGMGPCQGYPCWESMIALLASRTGNDPRHFARPSHRAPRRSITVAQAAGLSTEVPPER
jgi:sarcosine oxidase subunit alpha